MNSKTTKIFRALKISFSVIWWCVLISLALLLVNIFGAKMSGKVPSVFGYSVINIISGSMEDEIPKGSYILIKKTDAENVRQGDIICFYSTDPSIYGMPNTHRVVEEPIIKDGKIEFVTKGDASPVNDTETAKGDRLIGVYVKSLDGLTAFVSGLTPQNLIIVIICLLIATCTIFVFTAVTEKNCAKTANQDQEKKD